MRGNPIEKQGEVVFCRLSTCGKDSFEGEARRWSFLNPLSSCDGAERVEQWAVRLLPRGTRPLG